MLVTGVNLSREAAVAWAGGRDTPLEVGGIVLGAAVSITLALILTLIASLVE